MNGRAMSWLSIAAMGATASIGSASDVIIGNFSAAPLQVGTVFGAGTTSVFKAVGFRMGGEAYDLEKVTMSFDYTYNGAGGSATVSIWTGETFPTQEVLVLTPPALQEGIGDFDFTPPQPLTLEADTVYWVYLVATPGAPGSFRWSGVTPTILPSGIATHLVYIWNSNPSTTINRFEVRGTLASGCYADCDTSTGIGVLDIFDFLCFGNRFAAGDPYACDCDTTTGLGVCDIFDFLCFGNAFNAGCP